ncbi:MAG: signal transduction protein containing a rane domain an and a domain [Frankiales bacterium]|nr:signal transduction protein containing a rane domain an and a domain [Frankiales bacterium]
MSITRLGRVWLLTAVLVGAVVLLYATVLQGRPPPMELGVARWWSIAVLFGVAELFVAHAERARSALSHSLREVPAVFGLLLLAPGHYLLACLIGTGLTLIVRVGQSGVKLAFNLANVAFEGALAMAVYGWLAPGDPLSLHGWTAVLSASVLAHSVGGSLVEAAIQLAGDGAGLAAVLRSLRMAACSIFANSTVALLTVLLAAREPWALPLVAVLLTLLFLALRAHVELADRIRQLEALYPGIDTLSRSRCHLPETAELVLREARRLYATGHAELYVPPSTFNPGLHVVLDGPEVTAGVTPPSIPASTGGGRRHRVGPGRAMVAPMWLDNVQGVLVVADPIAPTAVFRAKDLELFQAFAAHCGVTLHGAALADDLLAKALAKEHEARHDSLTGLPNRRQFLRNAEEARAGGRSAVVLLGLDGFRDVNEALGHEAGDQVLVAVAQRLVGAGHRPVARLDGDQFAVLLTAVADARDAEIRGWELGELVRQPVAVGGVPVVVPGSVGIAVVEPEEPLSDAVLIAADSAMWQAKSSRAAVHVHVAEDELDRARRLRLAAALEGALADGVIEVWYQPQAVTCTGAVVAAEALVRWTHPVYGAVPPPEIVALAERTGQMRRLTDYVLRTALHQVAAWSQLGLALDVAVNVTTQDLADEALPVVVARLLAETGVDHGSLTLEITESGVMRDVERCLAVLDRLAALGVRLSVDDFGTGYSSLSYLQGLPVHEVKVDRSFVMRLAHDSGDLTMVRSIVDLGHALGLSVVAEGVETAEVLRILGNLDVDVVQGYHLGRPMPAAQFLAALPPSGGLVPQPRTEAATTPPASPARSAPPRPWAR